MKSTEDVLDALASGTALDYLLFWGHRPQADGRIGKSCFSQWFEAAFSHQGKLYPGVDSTIR